MRRAVFDIVYGTMERDGHSDEWFHKLVQGVPAGDWTRQEKNFIRRASYGTIERVWEIDQVINWFSKMPVHKLKPVIRTILRMGIYELWYMDSVPPSATCNEMTELAKKKNFRGLSGYVNGVLRHIAGTDRETVRKNIMGACRRKADKIAFTYSVPPDLVELLAEAYGEKTAKTILSSFEGSRPVTIRVQTMNADAGQVKKELIEAGIGVEDCRYVEHAFHLTGVERVEELPGFSEGHFTVQDESSMLPVLMAGIRPGDSVLDACGSPGGKAMQAADVLRGTGCVSVRDVSPAKTLRIQENADRMRIPNMEIKVWDGTVPDPAWRERADVVLADVPCSGIGVIGKKPEIRYHAAKHTEELVLLQRKIVEGAVQALRPGGTMIYSTCTVNPAENEENARFFSEEYGLELVTLNDFLPAALHNKMTGRGMLQILPGIHEGDGFFVARFVKTQG